MKVAAHPLVVAVALGLLAPSALEVVDDELGPPSATSDRAGSADALPAPDLAASVGVTADAEAYWATMDAPTDEDFAQVAADFERARSKV